MKRIIMLRILFAIVPLSIIGCSTTDTGLPLHSSIVIHTFGNLIPDEDGLFPKDFTRLGLPLEDVVIESGLVPVIFDELKFADQTNLAIENINFIEFGGGNVDMNNSLGAADMVYSAFSIKRVPSAFLVKSVNKFDFETYFQKYSSKPNFFIYSDECGSYQRCYSDIDRMREDIARYMDNNDSMESIIIAYKPIGLPGSEFEQQSVMVAVDPHIDKQVKEEKHEVKKPQTESVRVRAVDQDVNQTVPVSDPCTGGFSVQISYNESTGLISCEAFPPNPNYTFSLLIYSPDKLQRSVNLNREKANFPSGLVHTEALKEVQGFAKLRFKCQVQCGEFVVEKELKELLKYSCIAIGTGECKLVPLNY